MFLFMRGPEFEVKPIINMKLLILKHEVFLSLFQSIHQNVKTLILVTEIQIMGHFIPVHFKISALKAQCQSNDRTTLKTDRHWTCRLDLKRTRMNHMIGSKRMCLHLNVR